MERTSHLTGLLILIALAAVGGLFLWQNNQPAVTVAIPAPTATPGDQPAPDWQIALQQQLETASTQLPTPDLDVTAFQPPTLPPAGESTVVAPVQIEFTPWPTATPRPTDLPPTASGPTPFPSPTGLFIEPTAISLNYQPPPEEVPLSAHVNDHFWFVRPVDSSANSASLFYYPFGSNGPQNQWRVHHGVDMPNPIGEPIRAGGSGTVVFADHGGVLVDTGDIDVYPSYGLVVVIEHDFGYRGQKLFTLYAHMTALLVEEGERVEPGTIIGLSGGTGDVSGPHVHMEVRIGENKYFSVVNPLLWIAPYLGHGVVAGQVLAQDGSYMDDVVVTLSRRGRTVETTATYISPKINPDQRRDWHVLPDPAWQENFALGDIPAGDYEISVTVAGRRISQPITVKAGTVNFVTLGFGPAATPQAVESATDSSGSPNR